MFPGQILDFRAISLQEPPKQEMLAFLDAQADAAKVPARVARVQLIVKPDTTANTNSSSNGDNNGDKLPRYKLYELHVDLVSAAVVTSMHMKGRHSFIDGRYMRAAEKACSEDARVQAEIVKLEMPAGSTVVIEPWAYGTDGLNDMADRTTMVSVLGILPQHKCTTDRFCRVVLLLRTHG